MLSAEEKNAIMGLLRSQVVPAIGCTGSCLEEAGGLQSIYVNPDDDEAMAEALCNVVGNPELRQRMIAAGIDYAENYSKWVT